MAGIKKHQITIECPHCKTQITANLGQLKVGIQCVECNSSIKMDSESIKDLEVVENFEKEMHRICS